MKRLVCFFMSVLLSSVTHSAPSEAKPSDWAFDYRMFSEALVRPDSLSYEDLKRLITDRDVHSIEELLGVLSKDPKDLRFDRATFMHHSQSAQAAAVDPQHPRVIFHGDRLTLALTASPEHPDLASQLEIIEFDPKSAAFKFHRIDFGKKSEPQSKAHFIDEPRNCRQCHGEPGRPLWAVYALWPGAYGGVGGIGQINHTMKERVWLEQFVRGNAKKGVYRFFPWGETFSFLQENGIEQLDHSGPEDLSSHLNRLNYFRIEQRVEHLPHFKEYRYAILAASLDCPEIESYLPASLRKKHEKRLGIRFEQLLDDTRESTKAELEARVARQNETTGDHFEAHWTSEYDRDPNHMNDSSLPVASILAKLRFVIEGQGSSIKDWSMSAQPGEFSYASRTQQNGIGRWRRNVFGPRLAASDPDLARWDWTDLREPKNETSEAMSACKLLKKKSLAAFANLSSEDEPPRPAVEATH